MYRFPKTNNQLTPRNQVTPWLGKPFIISASEGAGCWFVLVLVYKPKGKPLSGSWFSISWTWQVHSVTYTFWLDWQNTTQIGNLSHIQKWKTLQMSKDMPMARCCIFPPKSGKTTFTKKTHFQTQYVYIYIYMYLHMYMWKKLYYHLENKTHIPIGGWSPQSKHSAIESLSTNRTNLSLCRHHFDLVSFGLQLLVYLIPSSQKPTNLLWSKNNMRVCVRVCV